MGALVSVVIPVYNVEKYVSDCLNSVTAQTLKDIEIICINDYSTDDSRSVVKSFSDRDSRISLYDNEKNLGLATTRNRGISLAKGKYIYFLDSDDMIEPSALEELYNAAERDSLDAAVFAARFIFEDESMKQQFGTNPAAFRGDYHSVLSGKELYKKWMEHWDWMPSQPRFFYRLDFLLKNKIRFIDGMLHEDETFTFDVLMNAKKIRILKEEYFIRRFRASSIMSSVPTMRNVEGCMKILSHVDSFNTDDEELKKAIGFYKYKIFSDVTRKFKAVRDSGQDVSYTSLSAADDMKDLYDKIKAAEDKSYELFACSSYYQVLVTLMIAMTKKIRVDIVLEVHGVETADKLAERLMECLPDTVGYAYVMPDSPEVDPYIQRETAADEKLSEILIQHVDGVMRQKVMRYDRINVFWDLGYLGTYLNIKGIPYTLHEDSLNSYQHIRENRPNYRYIFNDEERITHKGVVPFGYSPYCEEVHVNEIAGVQVIDGTADSAVTKTGKQTKSDGDTVEIRSVLDKLVEEPRQEMMHALSKENKKIIFDIFLPKDFKAERVDLLILTEPFAVTGRLPSEEAQIKLYKDLIEKYADRRVVIKAHPRDTLDYEKLFPEVTVIEKTIPMEVMNFDVNFHADRAITVASSAIYGLEQVDEKIYLGADYLEKYK